MRSIFNPAKSVRASLHTLYVRNSNQRGVALIITLCVLVLLTIAILAFFSRALINGQVAFSSTNSTRADFIAHSGLDIVLGEIRNEIADPTYSNLLNGIPANPAYPTVYQPKTSVDAIPQKVGVSSPDAIGAVTLVKVSASGLGIRPDGPSYLAGSSVPITSASLNGRYISTDRWFGSNGPQLGSQTTAPNWLLISRNNGVIANPAVTDAQNPTNGNFIIGRFAYTVYDLSGQMDANVAGYPTTAATYAGFKSAPGYNDLSPLGFDAAGIATLIGWRNPVTGVDGPTYDEWATGLEPSGGSFNQALAIAQTGHLSIATGDNAFLSRADLIQASQNTAGTGITPASLSYLTHFSRTLNAPTYSPTLNASANYNYQSNAETDTQPGATHNQNADLANVRYSAAGSVSHYDDFGNSQSYPVSAGDAVVQRRFSLAKIAWLQESEEGSASAPSAAVIQSSFGLVWDATDERWNYVGPSGTTIQSSIKTLTQVAAETTPREPNFFEMLKAGILSGTVGVTGPYGTLSNATSVESNVDMQVLRIGANIIDCAETDNYPTILALNFGVIVVEVAGVTDLPYFYSITPNYFTTQSTSTDPSYCGYLNNADLVMVPRFFNPHRTSTAPTTSGPTQVVADIVDGLLGYISFGYAQFMTTTTVDPTTGQPTSTTTQNSAFLWDDAPNKDLTALPPITIPSSDFEKFRSLPQPETPAAGTPATNTLGSFFSYCDPSISNMEAFHFFSCETEGTGEEPSRPFPAPIPADGKNPDNGSVEGVRNGDISVDGPPQYPGLIFRLRYLTRHGNLKTYATFGGYEAFPSSGISIATGIDVYSAPPGTVGSPGTVFWEPDEYMNLDPRTQRFGTSVGIDAPRLTGMVPSITPSDHISPPQSMGNSSNTQQIYFPQGGKGLTQPGEDGSACYVNTIDTDGSATSLRPNDGWLDIPGHSADPYFQNSSSTQMNTTSESRPVILHRPYRSVAELGYVFRDTPWKTLSFFDSTSADGGLLDLFSISDQPAMVAGLTNLNTQQTPVLTSILNSTGQYSDGSTPLASISGLVSAINSYAFSSGVPLGTMATNLGLFPSFMSSSNASAVTSSSDYIKYHREGVVRALGQTTQSRTWNLLIDVVAQAGRYPATAQSLNDFMVEGEKRYWLSVAVDRYTGKVIDEQLEPDNE